MNRFIAELNGGDHINIPADRMELDRGSNALLVHKSGELVCYVDLGAVMTAHMSNKG